MPNRRYKLCAPCSKKRDNERSRKYNEKKTGYISTSTKERTEKTVTIQCKVCEKDTEVASRLFKMCSECSRNKRLERCKNYKSKNREKVRKYNEQWKSENSELITNYNREYEKNRKSQDVDFKILRNLRTRLSQVVRTQISGNFSRSDTMRELLGIDVHRFVKWLELNFDSGMTISNYGQMWHIDHVVPCAWFNISESEDRKICFHWTNMRPLSAMKNTERRDTCNIREIFCQEIKAKSFEKNTCFRPLVTKFLEKSRDGSSES
jgi:hypothetical protein